ncbi:uncharacterized protein BP5553_01459 [Venustampulla echinocandica]|uniref:Uncharacterized protein n=1 Tax=Venustampulla echinocandica TaxID=2656787 RepID=A0A370U116_9HELO|nr:uncharacterized protein BP5553_01459 [Venustampulla echinocandica]RDL41480.1 hypothetical protein BP5553_01459 [Venustampulla echinocandica]
MHACSRQDLMVIQIPAVITERFLPVVSGSLRLAGVDGDPSDLPQNFAEYLENPPHDPYRNESGTMVQLDAYVAFSNSEFRFNAVFTVVPVRSGIVLGLSGFINRMVHTEIPYVVLKHNGEDIEENEWGIINISQWLDLDKQLHQV